MLISLKKYSDWRLLKTSPSLKRMMQTQGFWAAGPAHDRAVPYQRSFATFRGSHIWEAGTSSSASKGSLHIRKIRQSCEIPKHFPIIINKSSHISHSPLGWDRKHEFAPETTVSSLSVTLGKSLVLFATHFPLLSRAENNSTHPTKFSWELDKHTMYKEMAAHSSILAWRTPWTEEPGGLPSMGS